MIINWDEELREINSSKYEPKHLEIKGKWRHKKIIVDIDDYPKLSKFTWYRSNLGSPTTEINGKSYTPGQLIYGTDKIVSVKNNDLFDWRKSNLFISPVGKSGSPKNTNKSGFTGVTFEKSCNKYSAKIYANGVRYYLGVFDTPEEAAEAQQKKLNELSNL